MGTHKSQGVASISTGTGVAAEIERGGFISPGRRRKHDLL
jgi:hypothetical protein